MYKAVASVYGTSSPRPHKAPLVSFGMYVHYTPFLTHYHSNVGNGALLVLCTSLHGLDCCKHMFVYLNDNVFNIFFSTFSLYTVSESHLCYIALLGTQPTKGDRPRLPGMETIPEKQTFSTKMRRSRASQDELATCPLYQGGFLAHGPRNTETGPHTFSASV